MRKLVYSCDRPLVGWRRWYDLCRFYGWWWVNHLYARIVFGLKMEGEDNIPIEGPAILVSNHVSFLDANIISAVCPRKISFMIAREYYQMFGIHRMCEFLDCVPVNRNGEDLLAIKGALKRLKEGKLLGCFPEGGISTTGEMMEAKIGVGLLAARTELPVVPIHLSGYKLQPLAIAFFIPKRVHVKIGTPLVFKNQDYKNREVLVSVTNRIAEAIEELARSKKV